MQESGDQSAGDAVPREQAPTVGARLKSARESKDLALEKIADELRIEAHVLRALEEDRFDDIPIAPVFVKGYIKQYGRQLGLNYNELRAAYVEQIGSDEVDLLPSQAIQLRDERQITIWIIAALVLLLVGVFLLVWWLGDDGLEQRGAAAPASRPSVESPGAGRASGDAANPAGARPPAGGGAGTAAPAVDPLPDTRAPATAPSPQQESPSPAASAAERESAAGPSAAGTRSAASPSPALGGSPEPADGAAAITVRFREDSWAEITASDGRRIFYDLGAAGSELSFFATPPVDVRLGNADGVDVTVDDEPFAIPRRGRRGNIATFEIPPPAD